MPPYYTIAFFADREEIKHFDYVNDAKEWRQHLLKQYKRKRSDNTIDEQLMRVEIVERIDVKWSD